MCSTLIGNYAVSREKRDVKVMAVTSSNLNRFLKIFHWQILLEIYNKGFIEDPITPYMCSYITL